MILDLFRLDGKVALITGGGRGLGKAMAVALAQAGADVVIVSRKFNKLKETAEEIRLLGRKALPLAADITIYEQVEMAASQAVDHFGKIDILVNNAGVGQEKPVLDMSLADWDDIININLRAVFLCVKSIGAQMVKRGEGKIINVSSMYAFTGAPYMSAYCASKGAVHQFTRALALEWAPYNIQVNTICPGYFLTDINRDLFNSEKGKRTIRDLMLVGRLGEPNEIGGLAVYLASAASSYTTGAAFIIDSGQTAM